MKNMKFRLIVMNFLEFAVWGAYLTSMGRYLGGAGFGPSIGWFRFGLGFRLRFGFRFRFRFGLGLRLGLGFRL